MNGQAGTLRLKVAGWAQSLRALAEANRIPRGVKIAFQVFCFALASAYLFSVFRKNPGEIKTVLLSAHRGWIGAAVAALVGMQLTSAVILKMALAGRELMLGLGESFRITCISNFHSLVLPFQAGWGTRALMLNAASGLRYRDYALLSLGLWIVLIVVSVWAGGLALLVPFTLPRVATALGLTAAAVLGIRLARIPNGLLLLPMYVLDALLSGLRYRFLFLACGTEAGLRECIFMGCFTILAPLFAPVPGGLGVLESAIVLGSRMGKLPDEAGLAVAFLNRLLVSATFVLLGLGAQALSRSNGPAKTGAEA